jgi:hypothetical protein
MGAENSKGKPQNGLSIAPGAAGLKCRLMRRHNQAFINRRCA